MQDGSSTPVLDSLSTSYTFKLNKASLSLTTLKTLITELSGKNPTNPQPDGAGFSTTPFDSPPENIEFEVRFNRPKVDRSVNEEELALILRNVKAYFYDNSRYYEIARNTTYDLDGDLINLGEFLAIGISGVKKTDSSYEEKEDGLKQTIELLAELIKVLEAGDDATAEQDDDFITAQIPEDLRHYLGVFDLETWRFIHREIVTPLHQLPTYRTTDDTNLEHELPDYRRFINTWLDKAFESDTQKVKTALAKLTDKKKLLQKLKFAATQVLANDQQKNADDAQKLKLLYQEFNALVEAIFAEKPVEKLLKKLVESEDLVTEGGGSDVDLEDETIPKDEEEPVKDEQAETITVEEAENLVKENLYPLVLEKLEVERQIEDNQFLENLSTSAEKSVFTEQIRTEIFLKIIDTINLRPLLTDQGRDFYDTNQNLVYSSLLSEQLEDITQAALFSISESLLTAENGFAILTAAYQFAALTGSQYVSEDLTAPTTSSEQQQVIINALPQQFIANNNIKSYSDLLKLDKSSLLSTFQDQKSYLIQKRRMENVFLAYLQNNGANVTSLDQLNFGLQISIDNELDAYFGTLSSEDLVRFFAGNDPTFPSILAARLNRELLLGKFKTSGFNSRLHAFTQQQLSQQLKTAEQELNQVLEQNGASKVDWDYKSAEDIDRMTIEEFQKAFPDFKIESGASKEVFERRKQQVINLWSPPDAQKAVIQKLLIAYGSDLSFLDSLNTADDLNIIFGLNLPSSLSASEISKIKSILKKYWLTEIDKISNERNYYLNNEYAKQQGLGTTDSNSIQNRAFARRISTRSYTPVLSQSVRDKADLEEQAELAENFGEIVRYSYRRELTRDELSSTNSWDLKVQIALDLLEAEQAVTMAGALQSGTTAAYDQQGGLGRIGRLGQRFGLGKSSKNKAKGVANKAKRQAVQQAANALGPAAGVLNKIGDTIQDITGLSKDKQLVAAAGLTAAAIWSAIQGFLSNAGGFIGGIAGTIAGGVIGSFIPIPFGTVIGASVGFGVGSQIGKLAFENLGGFGGGSPAAAAPAITPAALSTQTATPTIGVAGFTIGTFTIVTVATALVTHQTINTALLLPTIGADNQLSKFIVIEKQAEEGKNFENGDLPNPVTYTVRISPRQDTEITIESITITNMTDTLTIKSENNSEEPREKNMEQLGYDEPVILTPGDEPLEITYTQEFDGTVTDASIENRFDIEFDVTYSSGSNPSITESTTAFTLETICVGDCPNSGGGCWPSRGIIYQLPFRGGHSDRGEDAFDIAAAVGTPVYAPFDGVVTTHNLEDYPDGWGNHVRLKTSDNQGFLFAHLSDFDVTNGENVTKGQQIGKVGSTGNSSGPHLHYVIAIGGTFASNTGNSIQDSQLAPLVPGGFGVTLFSPADIVCGE